VFFLLFFLSLFLSLCSKIKTNNQNSLLIKKLFSQNFSQQPADTLKAFVRHQFCTHFGNLIGEEPQQNAHGLCLDWNIIYY